MNEWWNDKVDQRNVDDDWCLCSSGFRNPSSISKSALKKGEKLSLTSTPATVNLVSMTTK